MGKFHHVALGVLTALLVIGFLAAGVPKLTSSPGWIRLFSHWGYPQWMLPVVGILEILGAAALVSRKPRHIERAYWRSLCSERLTHMSQPTKVMPLCAQSCFLDSLASLRGCDAQGRRNRPVEPRIFSSFPRYVRLIVSRVPS